MCRVILEEESQPKVERRTSLAASVASAAGLAGCLGDDGDGNPADDGAAEDDDGDVDLGGENADQELKGGRQPDWVLKGDDAFGRVEPDYDAVEATVDIRGEHVLEPDEIANVAM